MKRVLLFMVMVLLAVAAWSVPVQAKSNPSVYVDGKQLNLDVPAQIINGHTMVPMRAIFEALGAEIQWNPATEEVSSSKGNRTLRMTIGSNVYALNGISKVAEVSPQIVNGRTMVPVRLVSESLDCRADWDGPNFRVLITTGPNPDKVVNNYETSVYVTNSRKYRAGIKHQSVGAEVVSVYADLVDGRYVTLTLSCGSWDTSEQCQVVMTNGNLKYTIDYPDKSSSDPTDGGSILKITFNGGDLPKDPNYSYKFTLDGLKVNIPENVAGNLTLSWGGTIGMYGEVPIGDMVPNY